MASGPKNFKTGIKLSNIAGVDRVITINGQSELIESVVTTTELSNISGITSAVLEENDKGAADGVASLDSNSKILSSQLPAIAITEVFVVADIAARDALTVGSGDGEIQTGDVVIVVDASADPAVTSGASSYIHDGTVYQRLQTPDAPVLSVNGETGTVVLNADHISDVATTNKFATQAQLDKIDFLTVTQAVDLDTIESDVAANNAKVSADGSVTTHNDVTDAGSGAIITVGERALVASALQSGDNVSELVNDAGYITANAVDSVNGETGVVVIDADDISDAATINKFATQAQLDKVDFVTVTQAVDLDTIESDTSANNAKVSADGSVTTHNDVTDAGSGIIISGVERTTLGTALQPSDNISELTNDSAFVDAAGARTAAVVNSTAGSETDQAASVDAMKTYVDANGGNLSAGDIKETSFSFVNNQAGFADITGLVFSNGVTRSFKALIQVDRAGDSLYEVIEILGIQKGADWDIAIEAAGDDSGISLEITTAGQIRYSSSNLTSGGTIKFRADTLAI